MSAARRRKKKKPSCATLRRRALRKRTARQRKAALKKLPARCKRRARKPVLKPPASTAPVLAPATGTQPVTELIPGPMLSQLDNRKGAINENYARELMELFTLGADRGAHGESDVRELARTLSGWRATWVDGTGYTNFR